MKFIVTFYLVVLHSTLILAQSGGGSVHGMVLDSISKTSIESANVFVYSEKNKSFIKISLTFENGKFLVAALPIGDSLDLRISHLGYYEFITRFYLVNHEPLNVGPIYLKQRINELDTFLFRNRISLLRIKKDTIEYNITTIKAKPNDVVEDLLKQLPGLQVMENGSITFNGKQVSKILVDGREFFGGDPLIVTRNLPVNRIAKIQVVDTKTLEQAFNDLPTTGEFKTLNITLKKEENTFSGRINAGTGSDQRYELTGMLNNTKNNSKIDILTSTNNINKVGFGSGSDVSIVNQNNGISDSRIGGINYSDQFGSKVKLNGSYFIDNIKTKNQSILDKTQIALSDSSLIYYSTFNQKDRSLGNRFQFALDYDPDTSVSLHIFPALNWRNYSNSSNGNTSSSNSTGKKINQSVVAAVSDGNSRNYSAQLFIGKKLNNRGRSFSLGFYGSTSVQKNNTLNKSKSDYFGNAGGDSSIIIDQQIKNVDNIHSYGLGGTYVEPISKSFRLVLYENIDVNYSSSDKKTFNLDNPGNTPALDSVYSGYFSSRTTENSTNFSVLFNYYKWDMSFGMNSYFTEISNHYGSDKTAVTLSQFNLTPIFGLSYQVNKDRNIRFDYSANTVQPSPEQLKPVPDNSNPLFIKNGNPNLKPSLNQNFSLSYSGFNLKNNFSAGFQYYIYQNKIINTLTYDNYGRQFSQFTNVNGAYNLSGSIYYSKNFKTEISTKTIAFGFSTNYNKDITSVDSALIEANSLGLSPAIDLRLNYHSAFSFNSHYAVIFNNTTYNNSINQKIYYIVQTFRNEMTINFLKSIYLQTDVNFTSNSDVANGLQKNSLLWNAGLSKSIFKNNNGSIKLYIYDILKQNVNFQRTISSNYVQDVQSLVLQRYALLSFTYNFKSRGRSS